MGEEKVDILLVDDREENLYALEVVLRSPEYNLIKASSGEEALKYLLENDCALILMDVQMPGMDGFETASYIKKSPRSSKIPIIFITAINKDERFVHKGYKSGAVDYIFKPFEPDILKSKVEIFVELYKSKIEIHRQAVLLHEQDLKEREIAIAQLELRNLKRDQAAQKKYRDLVDGINHGIIWSADAATLIFSFVSPTAERIIGYPLERWYEEANFFITHVHPDDRAFFLKAIETAEENKDVGFEHRVIRSNGTIVWFHTGIRLAPKNDRKDYEIRGLSIDITSIKEAEEALRKSEERANLMAEASLVLSETLDYSSRLSKLGELLVPRFADLFSVTLYNEKSFEIQNINFTHENSKKLHSTHTHENFLDSTNKPSLGVFNVIRTGRSELYTQVAEENVSHICLDTASVDILKKLGDKSAMVIPLRTRGKILGAMTLVCSTSKRKYERSDLVPAEDLARRAAIAVDNSNLFKQAQDAIRARDEFLSVASHELKTPLTPLKLHNQSMMRSFEKGNFDQIYPGKLKRVIETSEKQITRLSQLIDNLLDISRINIGQLNLNVLEFSLTDLIEEIVDRFSEELSLAKCEVTLDIKQQVTGFWDKFRIEQILTNLLTNALKYGTGKPILIQVEKGNNTVTVTVKDKGIGIDKKDQARIFDRFERAVSPYNFRGLGLGLFIVKELVSMHFGNIRVESTLGEGSSFIVELPTNLLERNPSLQSAETLLES